MTTTVDDVPGTVPGALVAHHAATRPDAVSLAEPGRDPLDYRGLARRIAEVGRELAGLGVAPRSRVALVLPNGADLATAFLGVAAYGCAAPLNPAYRAAEFDFHLVDARCDALVVAAGDDSPAVAVARDRGIAVIELSPAPGPAGSFRLDGAVRTPGREPVPAEPGDVGLVLHTSGTTSRPKLVPLTHANLRAAATNTCRAFAIDDRDVCLNVMPLFHAHGLTSTLLANLVGGGAMVCTPGFSDTAFYDWFDEFRPTWFSAVPAMHHALLGTAPERAGVLAAGRLRVIRSASAPLPGAVLTALEETFGAPVVEAYGMTEAGSLVTSNPLPPGVRKQGSVGVPVGDPVAILDPQGRPVGPDVSGEIAIRGANVTAGYEDAPEANARAFTGGWLRTGDEGRLDADGYLRIEGRSKEIVNRGGSKVIPTEVDDVVAAHPAVRVAVAFGLPHPTLGEDVACAVVPRDGQRVDEREIRAFVAERLADYKVPSRVFVVADVPRTPAGKVQRLKLAELLASSGGSADDGPGSALQDRLAGIWGRVLGRDHVGPDENFFDLGGDSLLLARTAQVLREELGHDVELVVLTMYPTVRSLAGHLSGTPAAPAADDSPQRWDRGRDRLLRQRAGRRAGSDR